MMGLTTFDLPIGSDVTTGYGSNTVRLSDNTVLTSWLVGRADRLARMDPNRGSVEVIKNPHAGLLSAVVESYPGGPVWALCSFGLVELSLEPFKVIRRLSARIGKYSNYLVRLGDHALGVSTRSGKTTTLIDTATFAVTGRIAVNAPEISWPTEAGTTLFSFNFGKARTIGPDLRPIGKAHDIPVGTSPLHTDRGIAFLPGDYAAPAGFDSQELFATGVVDTQGSIDFMNPIDLSLTAGPTRLPIQQLHDADPDGRLFATDNNAAELGNAQRGRTVYLLDATGRVLLDTAEIDDGIYHVASYGPGKALVSHSLATTSWAARNGHIRSHFTLIQSDLV